MLSDTAEKRTIKNGFADFSMIYLSHARITNGFHTAKKERLGILGAEAGEHSSRAHKMVTALSSFI